MMPTIDVLLSWLATLGPGLAVYSVSHCLVKVEDSTSHRLILYSTSHLLGLLLLSLYVLASLLLEMQTFNNYARATFIALPAFSTGTLFVFGGRDRYQALKIIATHMVFVVLFAVTWGSVPIFGWDSLSYWVSSATPHHRGVDRRATLQRDHYQQSSLYPQTWTNASFVKRLAWLVKLTPRSLDY